MVRSQRRFTSLALLLGALALSLAGAAGCAHDPPADLKDDPAIQKRKADPGPRVEAAVALAPIEVAYATHRAEGDPVERSPLIVDLDALERDVASALVAWSPIQRIDPLEPRSSTTTPTVVDYMRDAYARGDEMLLQLTLRDVRAECLGRNGLFWPNILLWIELWVPAWFVRDEDYRVEIDAEATLYDVVAERAIASVPVVPSVVMSLDDLDRGWDFLGIWRLPDNLDSANWAKVRETMLPHALHDFERDLVLRAHDTLAPQATSRSASVVGLVVDVGQYAKNPAVVSSPSCANDGKALLETLSRKGRVPAKNLARLSGPAAARNRIEDDLRNRVAQRAREGDTIVVAFAGSGTTGADGQAYLLPYDADPAEPLERCAISLARLGELLAPSRARRLVVILDASFSGDRGLGRSVRMGAAPADGGTPQARLDALASALPGWSVAVLAAGAPDEGAGDLKGQGLFTLYLTRAVQSGAGAENDGKTTLEELHAAVAKNVSVQAGADGRKQTPVLLRWPPPPAKRTGVAESWLPTLDGPAPLEEGKPATATAAPAKAGAPPAPAKPVEPTAPTAPHAAPPPPPAPAAPAGTTPPHEPMPPPHEAPPAATAPPAAPPAAAPAAATPTAKPTAAPVPEGDSGEVEPRTPPRPH